MALRLSLRLVNLYTVEIFARFSKTEIVFDKSLSVQKWKGGKGPENEKLVERRTDGTIGMDGFKQKTEFENKKNVLYKIDKKKL